MQVKVFLASLLATILAVGVIATPTPVDVVDFSVTPPPDVNDVIEDSVQAFALGTSTATPDPLPTGSTITPGDDDVPTPSDNDVVVRDLEGIKKLTPCITVYTDSNFTGISQHACLPQGHCVNLGSFWRYNASSISLDQDTFCMIYTGRNCTGRWWGPFGWPGYKHLGMFNDNLGSVKCWWR